MNNLNTCFKCGGTGFVYGFDKRTTDAICPLCTGLKKIDFGITPTKIEESKEFEDIVRYWIKNEELQHNEMELLEYLKHNYIIFKR